LFQRVAGISGMAWVTMLAIHLVTQRPARPSALKSASNEDSTSHFFKSAPCQGRPPSAAPDGNTCSSCSIAARAGAVVIGVGGPSVDQTRSYQRVVIDDRNPDGGCLGRSLFGFRPASQVFDDAAQLFGVA
jgi:hypothetical protein